MKTNDKDIVINFETEVVHYVKSDIEQLSRVFINLFKNSIESLKEKHEKIGNFQMKIDVDIQEINDYISIVIKDNGTGFTNNDLKIFSKPYFTTKKITGLCNNSKADIKKWFFCEIVFFD